MKKFFVTLLLLTAVTSKAAEPFLRGPFLRAIAEVETGNDPSARGKAGERGAHQLHPAAFAELYRVSGHHCVCRADERYLDVVLRQMKAVRAEPTVRNVALAWNHGTAGATRRQWRPTDYTQRVENLYRVFSGQK